MANKPKPRNTDLDYAYFDRFDICAAWSLLVHDYGLYKTITRLHNKVLYKLPQRGWWYSEEQTRNGAYLEENARAIYDSVAAWFDEDLSRCDYYIADEPLDGATRFLLHVKHNWQAPEELEEE